MGERNAKLCRRYRQHLLRIGHAPNKANAIAAAAGTWLRRARNARLRGRIADQMRAAIRSGK